MTTKNSGVMAPIASKTVVNVLELIGRTPLIKLNKLAKPGWAEVYVKIDKFNPGGSVKDRIALFMLESAERAGVLTKKKTIIEPTSGNTGIGIALVAAIKGYKALLVMPENASIERRKTLEAYGASIILTPAEKGTDGAIQKAHEMLKKNPKKYFMPNQFCNKCNTKAHYETTGVEIWEQTGGRIDCFVAGIGTGGTLMGVGKRLKEKNQKIRVIGVEPTIGHKIQGLKNMSESKVPEIFDLDELDEVVTVKDEDAFRTARELAKKEGLLVGMSSGAAVFAALRVAKKAGEGKVIVAFAPDGGERYLSTELFTTRSVPTI